MTGIDSRTDSRCLSISTRLLSESMTVPSGNNIPLQYSSDW